MDWLEKIPVDGKPRKISEWLSYLQEPDRTIALKHCKAMNVEKKKMSKALSGAFIWTDTPVMYKNGSKCIGFFKQKGKWEKLYDAILDHEQKAIHQKTDKP